MKNKIEHTLISGLMTKRIIKKNNKYNLIDNRNRLLCNMWFDKMSIFENNRSCVKLNNKYNYINPKGELLFKRWHTFDDILVSRVDGIYRVVKDGMFNIINKDENLICDVWYDEIEMFNKCGYARVRFKNQYNYIDVNGKLLLKNWLTDVVCGPFLNGYARITSKNDTCNFIDVQGNYIFKKWYSGLGCYVYDYTPVFIPYKGWNFIDKNENIISNEYYDEVEIFENDLAKIKKQNKYNFINKNGKLLLNIWADDLGSFLFGYATICKNNKWNFINKKGKLLLNNWYDDVFQYTCGIGVIKKLEKYNFVDVNGCLISNVWYDNYKLMYNTYIIPIKLNDKWNFINEKNNILLDKWYCDVLYFNSVYYFVKLNDRWNIINIQTKQYLLNIWFDKFDIMYIKKKNDFVEIKANDKYNIVNNKGILLSNVWFEDIHYSYTKSLFKVKLNDNEYDMNISGDLFHVFDGFVNI